MSAAFLAFVVFVCAFGGALFGVVLQRHLPEDHRSSASQGTVTVTMGLVGSMTALVLGLVTASAKDSYDGVDDAVRKTAVDLLVLDRTLARYGAEAQPIRTSLKSAVAARVGEIWPTRGTSAAADSAPSTLASLHESFADRIRDLPEDTELRKALRTRSIDLSEQLLQERWLMVSHASSPVPTAFLVILIFWLTATFGSFGLFAPRNYTVFAALGLGAVSVSAALYLVLELGSPFEGGIMVSGEPLQRALMLMAK
jgi:hypothetical protein